MTDDDDDDDDVSDDLNDEVPGTDGVWGSGGLSSSLTPGAGWVVGGPSPSIQT